MYKIYIHPENICFVRKIYGNRRHLHAFSYILLYCFRNWKKKCFLLVSTLILERQVIYIPHFYSLVDCILVIINIINTSVESANPFASKWICLNLSLESHSFFLIFSPHKTREWCFRCLSSWVDNIFFYYILLSKDLALVFFFWLTFNYFVNIRFIIKNGLRKK